MGEPGTVSDVGDADAERALAEAASWDDPQLLGYHHPAYQRMLTPILGDALRCLVVREPNGAMAGLLPYRLQRSPKGSIINALPFFGCTGAAAARPGAAGTVVPQLLEALRDRARAPDVFTAAFYSPFAINPAPWMELLAPDDVLVKFTQSLSLGEGDIAWPTKRRGDLRRAADRGFVARRATMEDAASIWSIYAENCRLAGIPLKPEAFITGTLELAVKVGEQSPMQWLVATLDGSVVAALLYGRSRATGSYILPCADAQVRASQPNAFLMDQAIRDSRAAGVRYWNFESSPEWGDPVFKFKERWGAEATPFAIFLWYGHAAERPAAEDVAAARQTAPFYFVAPAGRPTGLWPVEVPLPASYSGLRA